jgi:hypothetical protein
VLPQLLISTSAAIVLILGAIHLVYTFASNKFFPRDPSVAEQMKRISPVISKQTTMWRAWIGFNASHSLGAMLFGVLYGYLSVFQFQMLLQARFLLFVGAIFLASILVLAKRYWFSIPFAGIASSLVLYVVGAAVAVA